MKKWVTQEKASYTFKNWSQLEKYVSLGKKGHLVKWVTLEKVGRTRPRDVTLVEEGQTWTNGSHL